jgi:hypothetical protein
LGRALNGPVKNCPDFSKAYVVRPGETKPPLICVALDFWNVTAQWVNFYGNFLRTYWLLKNKRHKNYRDHQNKFESLAYGLISPQSSDKLTDWI